MSRRSSSTLPWWQVIASAAITAGLCLPATRPAHSQEPTPLQQTLEDVEVGGRWSYNDWESAKAAAAKSKKPILALFR